MVNAVVQELAHASASPVRACEDGQGRNTALYGWGLGHVGEFIAFPEFPCMSELLLEGRCHGAAHEDARITPGVTAEKRESPVLVGDVQTAGKGGCAVHGDDLRVVPVEIPEWG